METTGELQGATAGTSLRSGRTIQGLSQMSRGYGDQEPPIYDERNDEEVFSPCKDNMDGLNDGSVRQKQRQQTNMEKAQDANLLNRRSVTEEEDLPSSSHQSRIQLLEQIAKLEAQLKNNKEQHQSLQDNEIQIHQRPSIMETEIVPTGPSRNINRMPFQNSQIRTKPPVFDGTSTWSSYLKQFELVAEMNKWSPQQKALNLATSLKGEAQSILDDLDSDKLHDYSALINIINQRFGSEHQTEMFRAILRNRVRQPRETLPQLAHEIRRLVKLAYPTREHGLLDDLTKEHFINSLPDADTRWKIHQSRPQNLDESVRVAVELEAFQVAEQHRTQNKKTVRVVATGNETPPIREENDRAYQQTETTMDDLPKILEAMSKQLERLQPRRPYDDKKRSRGCFICNDPGHFQRDCPQYNDRRQRNRNNRWSSGN